MTDTLLKIIDERESTIHNLVTQCDTYRKQLQESDELLSKSEEKHRFTVDALNKELSGVRAILDRKNDSLVEETTKLNQGIENIVFDEQKQLDAASETSNHLQNRIEELLLTLESEKSKRSLLEENWCKISLKMKEEFDVEVSENISISSAFDKLKNDHNSLLLKLDELSEERDNLRQKCNLQEENLDNLLKNLESNKRISVEVSSIKYEHKVELIQQDMLAKDSEISSLQGQLEKHTADNTRVRLELDELTHNRDELQKQLDEMCSKSEYERNNEELIDEMSNQLFMTQNKLLQFKKELQDHGMIPNDE